MPAAAWPRFSSNAIGEAANARQAAPSRSAAATDALRAKFKYRQDRREFDIMGVHRHGCPITKTLHAPTPTTGTKGVFQYGCARSHTAVRPHVSRGTLGVAPRGRIHWVRMVPSTRRVETGCFRSGRWAPWDGAVSPRFRGPRAGTKGGVRQEWRLLLRVAPREGHWPRPSPALPACLLRKPGRVGPRDGAGQSYRRAACGPRRARHAERAGQVPRHATGDGAEHRGSGQAERQRGA